MQTSLRRKLLSSLAAPTGLLLAIAGAVAYGTAKGMVGEVKEAYESLSARGRVVFKEGLAKTAHRDITPPVEQSTDYEQPPTS